MRKLILFLFLLCATPCYGAEFLIKLQPSWISTVDDSELTPLQIKKKRINHEVGDTIVVKPDGWKWGKKECLPKFVIVKVPGMTVREALLYLEEEKDENGMPLRARLRGISSAKLNALLNANPNGIANMNEHALEQLITVK